MVSSSDLKLAWSAQQGKAVNLNWESESDYYLGEFQRIHDSEESFKGSFNWAALLLGAIWCLGRNLEWHAAVWVLLALFTGGWVTPLLIGYNIYLGFRGNYIRYARVAKGTLVLVGD